jgi:3-oxoacyl-[acyl-carrier-protein] synthase I
VLELESLRVNRLIPSGGFEELGTTGKITVLKETEEKELNAFLKTASGFGGCNASMLISSRSRPASAVIQSRPATIQPQMSLQSWVRISNGSIQTSSENIDVDTSEDELLISLYRKLNLTYPKFFKMDEQSKLGFLGSQLLLRDYAEELKENDEGVALVFANATSSLKTDREYLATVGEEGTGSPAKFIYTLPNVVIGEVCIYWKQYNETQFLVLPEFDAETMLDHAQIMFSESDCKYVLIGWTEVGGDRADGFFALLSKNDGDLVSVEELSQLYDR